MDEQIINEEVKKINKTNYPIINDLEEAEST